MKKKCFILCYDHSKIAKSIREMTFGIEDGLISILGLVAGVTGANVSNNFIVLAGVAGMIPAAISMASGVYLSNKSQKEYLETKFKKNKLEGIISNPLRDALVIGISFIIAGWIPIIPFLFFVPKFALAVAFGLTIIALFVYGASRSHYTKENWFRSGIEMVGVSIASAAAGYLVGYLFKFWFGV